MRSARCVFEGFRRKRSSAVLLLGLTGKSHLQTVVILTRCWCQSLESIQTELAITGGEKMVLVMNPPPPLHHVSLSVPMSLINFVWTWTVFSSLRIASAVLGPVRFPQIASCLVFHPLSFILVYFMPSHVQGMAQRVCLSGNPAWGSCVSQSVTRSLWRRWVGSAQSGKVPLGCLPSGVWHWRHCWCQVCPRSCTCSRAVPSTQCGTSGHTQLVTVSLLRAVLGIPGAGMSKQTIKCCPPSS